MISIKNLKESVQFLSTIQPARSYNNINSLNNVAQYIEDKFIAYELKTNIQTYNVGSKEYKNIEASINNHLEHVIVVGAHYDVCGEHPGADDNASAIAGLLELARVLNRYKDDIPYKILLVAYTLEEPPYFATTQMGSYVHAKSLKDNAVQVNLMICLEMIGYFTEEENSQNYPIDVMKVMYPSKGNFIALISDMNSKDDLNAINDGMKQTSVPSEIVTVSRQLPGAGLSDHRNYWEMGYKAVMITDTAYLRNPHYHKDSDTIETLNFDKMAEVVSGLVYYFTKTHKNYNLSKEIK